MSRRIAVDELLRFLAPDDARRLEELRAEGLFEADELDAGEAEELRVAAVLMGELGVNPAGVEVALQLRRRLLCLQERMERLLHALLEERREP